MDMNAYQKLAHTTAIYGNNFSYCFLGLAGEAGELCNQAKKVIRDDDNEVRTERWNKMVDELGDVLWYAAAIATVLNITLNEVATQNLDKLNARAIKGTLKGDSRIE